MPSPSVLEVVMLRSGLAYRQAEILRRKKYAGSAGVKKWAALKEDSVEYGSLRLLIGTWDSMGSQILALPPADRVPFYQTNPVGYMWELLKPAVMEIRKKIGHDYAKNFEKLAEAYKAWLQSQPPEYQTAAQNGLSAQFG